ncbi:hypothetical protein CRUP_032454, partial [Coryphaenoides rupestris]
MMIRPKGLEALEIVYNTQNTESWDLYTQALDRFLTPYNDSIQIQKNDECDPDKYNFQNDMGEVKNNPKRSCQFNRTMLGSCSGLTDRDWPAAREGRHGSVRHVNYSQPLVAIKFLNITTNEDVNVECKIISTNIPAGSDRDKFAGRVSFKLRIN